MITGDNKMQIPLIPVVSLYHIGTMDASHLGRNSGSSSQEGNCLSVSLCPNTWEDIAKLGGNICYELTKSDAAFLDVYAVFNNSDLLAHIIDWAKTEKLCISSQTWRAWLYDEEDDEWRYFSLKSREEAENEVDDPDATRDNGKPVIDCVNSIKGTKKLYTITGRTSHKGEDATDAVITAWARQTHHPETQNLLDGIWWRENHNLSSLSAPRGGIFPERVMEWKSKPVCAQEIDDEVSLEMMPETTYKETTETSIRPAF
jgi:hypothetical protein